MFLYYFIKKYIETGCGCVAIPKELDLRIGCGSTTKLKEIV